jgi:hypothetical protein
MVAEAVHQSFDGSPEDLVRDFGPGAIRRPENHRGRQQGRGQER